MRAMNYIPFLIFLIACKGQPKVEQQLSKNSEATQQTFPRDTVLNLYEASLRLPKGWRLAKNDTLPVVGDATARYRFHNSHGKLIYFQYGLGTIGNPAEPDVQSSRFRKGYLENGADTSEIIFTDNPKLVAIRQRSGHKFTEEEVSGFQALVYQPKRTGKGFTGIYIDSVGAIAGNIAGLTLYAQDLDSAETTELFMVIRSLKMKPFH